MSATSLWGQLKTAAAAGVLFGGYPFARKVYFVGDNAPQFGQQMSTIAAAINIMLSGDVLILGPQAHAEGNLSIPATKTNLTFIGAGNSGACFIEPAAAGDEGLEVLADDFTLINVGVAGGSTSDYALKIGENVHRFRAYGCKFEGPDGTCVLLDGVTDCPSDALFDDCEFVWCGSCILFGSALNNFPTQIFIRNCKFHNFTAVGVGLQALGGVGDLELTDSVFGKQEDGTAPTDFIKVDANSTGIISGCRFATPTNDSALLTIDTNVMWGPNGTEAGWSSARPAP